VSTGAHKLSPGLEGALALSGESASDGAKVGRGAGWVTASRLNAIRSGAHLVSRLLTTRLASGQLGGGRREKSRVIVALRDALCNG
jgi:hypothetical protein